MKRKGRSKIKKRKIKFKQVTFKLSERQHKSISNYCKARKTTLNKLLKKSIERYMNGYEVQVPKQFYVSERQLELFSEEKENLSSEA